MGSLFLQIGQCGCQIGAKLNPLLSNSYYCTRNRNPHRLHTIMIDSQPKVLRTFLQKPPKWLDTDNVKYFEHGRGNNWSYGYLHDKPQQKINTQIMANHRQFSHKCQNQVIQKYIYQNKKISQFVLNRMRKELQTVDTALCINVVGSLGGGTGSGVGTKIVQLLDQQFNIDIYAHCVLPNMSGQTPLQIYNCSLSLSILQDHSNAIFPLQNDKYLEYFRQKNPNYFLTQSLDTINEHIANSLSKFIKINDLSNYDRFYTDIASNHLISPEMKYLSLLTTESKNKTEPWDQCFQELFQHLKIFNHDFSKGTIQVEREKFLSGEILLIGKQNCQFQKKYNKKLMSLLNPYQQKTFQYSQIQEKGTHFSSLIEQKNEKAKKNPEKQKSQLILIMNHSNVIRYLSYLCQRGRLKFQNKAYLWHYQYVDIQQAFEKLQLTIDQYKYFAHGNV